MSDRFYMMCTRETVGSNASFHRHNGSGYSTNVSEAYVYTLAEAQSSWELGREIDQPISADAVDGLTVYHVDHQHIPYESVRAKHGFSSWWRCTRLSPAFGTGKRVNVALKP